eukprot:gene25784-11451_t
MFECFKPGVPKVTANELERMGHSQEAVDAAVQLLINCPKSMYTREFSTGDTIIIKLARSGNVPMINAVLKAARETWKDPTARKVVKWAGDLHPDYRGAHVCESEEEATVETEERRGQQAVVQGLVNARNRMNQTPLHMASRYDWPETITVQIPGKVTNVEGADPWKSDQCGGLNAMHWACKDAHYQCLVRILDQVPQNSVNEDGIRYVDTGIIAGFTSLHYAVDSGSVPCVRALLKHRPNLLAKNCAENLGGAFFGYCVYTTPLHVAAREGHAAVCEELLRHYVWQRLNSPTSTNSLMDPRTRRDANGNTPYSLHATIPFGIGRSNALLTMLTPETELAVIFAPDEMYTPADGTVKLTLIAFVKGISPADGSVKLTLMACAALKRGLTQQIAAERKHSPSTPAAGVFNDADPGVLGPSPKGSPTALVPEHGDLDSPGGRDPPPPLNAMLSNEDADEMSNNTCGICLSEEPDAQIMRYRGVGCNHVMCCGCAMKLCARMTSIDAAPCPFCRRPIPGFKPYTADPSQVIC